MQEKLVDVLIEFNFDALEYMIIRNSWLIKGDNNIGENEINKLFERDWPALNRLALGKWFDM